jgi:hypothetical protein
VSIDRREERRGRGEEREVSYLNESRICGHNSIDIFPDLNLVYLSR